MQLNTEVETAVIDGDQVLLLDSSGARARGRLASPWLCALVLFAAGIGGRGVWTLCGRRTGTNEVISLSGSAQMTTVTVDVAILPDPPTNKKSVVEKAVKDAIVKKGGLHPDSVDGELATSGTPKKMPVKISVPPGTSADAVINKLRDGVDVAAEIESALHKDTALANTRVYSSAVKKSDEKTVRTVQSQQSTVVVDMVLNGIDLTQLTQAQKDLIPKAVQEAITSKGQVPAGDMLLVISPDAHVTANLHIPKGTEAATMSRLQNGEDVAGVVEAKLKEQMKAIPKVDATAISVYTSYLKRAPLRKFYDNKIVLNVVVDGLPAQNGPKDDDIKTALKAAIVSKGQLDSNQVEVRKKQTTKWQATISVPQGTDAEARKTELQSRLQKGADVAVSMEEKLKGIKELKDEKNLAVYTSPLKLENVAGLAVDLIVDGIDFGRLDDVPALLVQVVQKMQKKIVDEVKTATNCATADEDDVALLFPSDMTSGSVSVQAQITKPAETTCKAEDIMTELGDIAHDVECELQKMDDLKYFVASSVDAIQVSTPDTKHEKKACAAR